jgi:hypothetical protein
MATDRPPPRPGPRRAAGPPPKIQTGPRLSRFVPYVLAVAVAVGLVYLTRQPRYAATGALLLGLGVMIAAAYFAISNRLNLGPDDGLRRVIPPVAVLAALVAATPYALTLFPPGPQGEADLTATGQAQSFRVRGVASSVWLMVRGRFAPGASDAAHYSLVVTRDGGATQALSGALRPHPGGPPPEQHVLTAHGAGEYTVRLDDASRTVALPLHVAIHARPFSVLLVALLFGVLAAGILAVDVMLRRRGLESSFAAVLFAPLAAVLFFQRHLPGGSITDDLLASLVVGLGGLLGAEVLSRIVLAVSGK